MIEDKALLNEYLSEAEEFLDSLLADLDLLAGRIDAEPDPNLINRIFRTLHSLKGLSGMMGFAEIQSLAHEFEDILDDLRLGHFALDPEAAAQMQEAGAAMASLFGVAARSQINETDIDRLRELLASVTQGVRTRAKKDESALESLGLSERERDLLTEYELHRITENFNAGRAFYFINVEFEIGDLDSSYRAMTSRLEEKGELLTTLPEPTEDASRVAFKLLFATQGREAALKQLLEPFGGRINRLGRFNWRRAGEALRVVGRRAKKSKGGDTEKSGDGKRSGGLPAAFAQESLQPLSPSVRVELSQIDELSGLAHELAIEAQRLTSMAEDFLGAAGLGPKERFDLKFSARRMEREFLELEERLVELRMVSLAQTFTRAARLAGRLARELGKSVTVEVKGRERQLDKMIVDRIADSIYHILRNAIDHGVEMPEDRRLRGKSARGRIKIEASLEGTNAVIALSDDGRGIDLERVRERAVEIGALLADQELSEEEMLRLIFAPGFSTAGRVSAVSGRGVGLDAVERTIHELGGEIRVWSDVGRGSRFEIVLPTTLVMISAFIVRVSEWYYAIGVSQIIELLYIEPDRVLGRDGRRNIEWNGMQIPLVELRYMLGLGGARVLHRQGHQSNGVREKINSGLIPRPRLPVLISRVGGRPVAIAVDEFHQHREIIVKSLGPLARIIKGVTGAVDLEAGDVALVLDLPSLLIQRSMRL